MSCKEYTNIAKKIHYKFSNMSFVLGTIFISYGLYLLFFGTLSERWTITLLMFPWIPIQAFATLHETLPRRATFSMRDEAKAYALFMTIQTVFSLILSVVIYYKTKIHRDMTPGICINISKTLVFYTLFSLLWRLGTSFAMAPIVILFLFLAQQGYGFNFFRAISFPLFGSNILVQGIHYIKGVHTYDNAAVDEGELLYKN